MNDLNTINLIKNEILNDTDNTITKNILIEKIKIIIKFYYLIYGKRRNMKILKIIQKEIYG